MEERLITGPPTRDSVERLDLFTLRLVTYAPGESAQRWITEELNSLPCVPYFAASLRAAFEALAEEFRRRVIIVDYDALSKDELVELRMLRSRNTSGTFIALGNVREHLRAPLRVTHVLPRPFGSEVLRNIVDELERQRDTQELLRLPRF
ncbi:MAG TPA: hypothetical protein VFV99_09510 [Kofleriaceae bacterium]|nr:hypothetical protein [Kofleriaceae bacterium]